MGSAEQLWLMVTHVVSGLCFSLRAHLSFPTVYITFDDLALEVS